MVVKVNLSFLVFCTIDIEAAIDKGRNTTKRTTLAPIVVLIFTAATLVVDILHVYLNEFSNQ